MASLQAEKNAKSMKISVDIFSSFFKKSDIGCLIHILGGVIFQCISFLSGLCHSGE